MTGIFQQPRHEVPNTRNAGLALKQRWPGVLACVWHCDDFTGRRVRAPMYVSWGSCPGTVN